METIITVRKEDLLKLLEVASEKEEKRRKMLKEKCHFDIMLNPVQTEDKDFLAENYSYRMYIEYFTSPINSNEDNDDSHVTETCKIEYTIPAVVMPSDKANSPKKLPILKLPILIGLVGIPNIQKIIDIVNKIDSESIDIKINPIEVEGMLSYSIIDDIEDHILPSSKT